MIGIDLYTLNLRDFEILRVGVDTKQNYPKITKITYPDIVNNYMLFARSPPTPLTSLVNRLKSYKSLDSSYHQ